MWTQALVWRVSKLGHYSNYPFSLFLCRFCPPVSPAKTTRRLRHLGGGLHHWARRQRVGATLLPFCTRALHFRNTSLRMKGGTFRPDGSRPKESKLETRLRFVSN
ncbi:hypothetical protein PanWU01x14_301240 [Parasponia andersonii]|uniref:Uncharacterized protein n=1 Tax=Parasponia andersonii TaxID=3476 RepID=A0A2P5ATN7_PARAD|nr:hypothetical protein PanWU01x14_301240 [Parasponia andersonii]